MKEVATHLLRIKSQASKGSLSQDDYNFLAGCLLSKNHALQLLCACVICSSHVHRFLEQARPVVRSAIEQRAVHGIFIQTLVYEALVFDNKIQPSKDAVLDIIENYLRGDPKEKVNVSFLLRRFAKKHNVRASELMQKYRLPA